MGIFFDIAAFLPYSAVRRHHLCGQRHIRPLLRFDAIKWRELHWYWRGLYTWTRPREHRIKLIAPGLPSFFHRSISRRRSRIPRNTSRRRRNIKRKRNEDHGYTMIHTLLVHASFSLALFREPAMIAARKYDISDISNSPPRANLRIPPRHCVRLLALYRV